MNNSKKILEAVSSVIESGILTSKDLKKELSNDFKFQKDKTRWLIAAYTNLTII